MTVSLVQWRALIGIFNCRISGTSTTNRYNLTRKFVSMLENLLLSLSRRSVYCRYHSSIYFCSFTLTWRYWTKPRTKKIPFFFVCHWNLNSLSVHNFSKLTQMKAYISMYKHDFICLLLIYLDSSTPDGLLEINGHILFRTMPVISKEVKFTFTTVSHSLFEL